MQQRLLNFLRKSSSLFDNAYIKSWVKSWMVEDVRMTIDLLEKDKRYLYRWAEKGNQGKKTSRILFSLRAKHKKDVGEDNNFFLSNNEI